MESIIYYSKIILIVFTYTKTGFNDKEIMYCNWGGM